MSSEAKPTKAILYADGGYQSRFGSGGWGVHGYVYVDEPPTRGTGNPKAIPTANGYATDKESAERVTVHKYVDGVGGVHQANSSNQTELTAAIQAMEWTLNNDVHHTTVFTDSRYVTNGITDWLPKWKDRGWKNGQGEEVANKDLWLKADDLIEQLRNNQKHVRFEWIKGHAGFFGNEMADSYATKGNVLGRRKDTFTYMSVSDPEGYWNKKNDYHKLLGSGRWYFSTIDLDYKREDGSHIYYLGDLLDDEHSGKPVADNAMAVVYMKEPDPVLEKLRECAMEMDNGKRGSVILGRLDVIFSPNVYTEIQDHGTVFMNRSPRRLDILTAKDDALLKEKSPPGLVWLAVDVLNSLERKLEDWLNNESYLTRTDLMDIFYEKSEKKGECVYKLKKDITSSTKSIDVGLRYNIAKGSEQDSAEVKTKKARLLLAIDVPKRNTLAGIADEIEQMELISWRESDSAVRYASVIRTKSGVGIWAGVDSNYLIV